jgi:hypothetical protein
MTEIPYFEDWFAKNGSCFLDIKAGWAYYLSVYHTDKRLDRSIYSSDGKIKDPFSLADSILNRNMKKD